MNSSWFIRQPVLFRRECEAIAREFPEMRLDEGALADGRLVFQGTLVIARGRANEDVVLSLEYPEAFPYARPEVIPLIATTDGGSPARAPRFFSARHQMANGSICLFEREPQDDPHSYVTGVDALRRARTWLPHAMRGVLPKRLDTLESELEAHYNRLGDVLLGPMMFEDLGSGGELVLDFFPAFRRGERYPLHAVTHVRGKDGWHNDEQSLDRIGLDRPSEFWSATPPATDGVLKVKWWRLEQEPPPVRTVDELARLIFPDGDDAVARLKGELASDLASRNAVHVPLCFPNRAGTGIEWLFLRIPIRESSLPKVTVDGHAGQLLDFGGKDVFDGATIGILRSQDLRQRSLTVRNKARVPTGVQHISLVLAGAGALGSTTADLLAKAGVGRLRVIDPALLNAHNAVRHLAGVGSAGMPKALVVAASVNAHNPHCDITCAYEDVLKLPAEDPLWQASCVISTIADDAVELALNRMAAARRMTVYYLRALRSGSTGRLVRVRPGADACLECVGHYHAEGSDRAIAIPPQPDEVIARECGQPVLAASAADLAVVAGLGVRTLLDDLVDPTECNQWVWTSEGIPELADLQSPFSSSSTALAPHPKCGVCGVGLPDRVHLPEELRSEMARQAREHAPNETGGILIGRRRGEVVEVLAVSDAGPNAISEPARFERDGEYCQAYLERTVRELGGGVDYVGEWHSHPGSSATPSTRDTASFAEIAEDPDYLTTAPVLVIVAPAMSDDRVDWSFNVFPAGGLARAIQLDGADAVGRYTESIATDVAVPSDATV